MKLMTDIQNKHIYWIGSRYSDISDCEWMIYGSITLYGKTHGNHVALCDTLQQRLDNNVISDFINDTLRTMMHDIAKRDPYATFYFYNPKWRFDIGGLDDLADRIIAVNDEKIYRFYNSKIKVFGYMRDKVSMLDARVLPVSECRFDNIKSILGESADGYVVQAEYSDGGTGTNVINDGNAQIKLSSLDKPEYIVSRYYKQNIPVNFHAVVFEKGVVLLPGSIQILNKENDKLIYKGADYVAFRNIDKVLRDKAYGEVKKVCDIMRADGYRGVVGVDAIIYDGKVAVVEVNTRFQGSSAALNIGLRSHGLDTLQQLNLKAFSLAEPDEDALKITEDIRIDCSCYSYANVKPYKHSAVVLDSAGSEPHVLRTDLDGWEKDSQVDDGIHKFRLCFDRNICAVNFDNGVWLHENICEPNLDVYQKIVGGDVLALKITLLTQGVRLAARAEKYLKAHGGIREGNNNAVDILIRGLVINAPCDVDFIGFTPYLIDLDGDDKLQLYYYDVLIDEIKLYPIDALSGKRTKSGRYYADIAYLSTDRLRVHMTNKCIYKKQGRSCKFCNIDTEDTGIIPMEDICEVLDDYINNAKELKHFLVGGQSAEENTEKTRVVDIIRAIRARSEKDIYAMILPFSEKSIREMKDAGMTELACNMEVFDDELARRCMPGKGTIARRTYIDTLSKAAETYGNDHNSVRSAMIIGLESHTSLMKGLETLLQNGIQPILSVFRPLVNTELESLMMPPADYLYRLFIETERLCRKYGFSLGPQCINCQNNTLSLPKTIADTFI